MTNVPQPSWTTEGFVIPASLDVLDGVLADWNAAFGGQMNLDQTTPHGQLAVSQAALVDFAYQTFLFYTQQVDPAFATGRMQDAIGRIYFMTRVPASSTVVSCVCTGLAGTIIPAGALAVAADGTLYSATGGGTIPVSGSITLEFSAVTTGPINAPAGTVNAIYKAISGWDTITNPTAGVVGADAESTHDFEIRRKNSVAANGAGSLPAILGAVLAVSGVVDAYVTENTSNTAQTIGGVSLNPNSVYVAALGGTDADVAKALWTKKSPGCNYNGSTVVTVQDTNSGYATPYPSYSVSFTRPTYLATIMAVTIPNTTAVPADALAQIQTAVASAFAGTDGGERVRIGATLFASRFYAGIAALGSWAKVISVEIGSSNSPGAAFTASVSGDTMTVSAVSSGALAVGQTVQDTAGNIPAGTKISALGTGTGGTGTYTLSNTLTTVASENMTASSPTLNSIPINIDQVPSIDANDITLVLQ